MIHLIDIDENNWRTPLAVAEEQKHFVASRTTVLARAYAYRNSRSRAFLICENDMPVGMGLYYDCEALSSYIFSEIFIDEKFQRNGFASIAVELALNEMKKDKKYSKVTLCYIEGNHAAQNLYHKFGFVETGKDEDEIIMELEL